MNFRPTAPDSLALDSFEFGTTPAPRTLGDSAANLLESFERRRPADSDALDGVRLPAPGHPDRVAAIVELVRLDLEYGWDAGRPTPLSDYLGRYPELGADPAALAQVEFEERRQRANHSGEPDDSPHSGEATVVQAGLPAAGRVALPASADSLLVPAVGGEPAARARGAYPEPGERFLEFRILDEIGRGAFARVFLARQGDLAGRPVALKLSPKYSDEPQTLAQLQHTNVVPIYSLHQANGLHAVCMPYFGSTTLADVVGGLRASGAMPGSGSHLVSTLNNRKDATRVAGRPELSRSESSVAAPPAPTGDSQLAPAAGAAPPKPALTHEMLDRFAHSSYVDSVLWLAARIADGLAHAHSRGVVHRDLKPANVLLTDEGQPMILDFNLSETGDRAARLGGTIPYMAPEHLEAFLGADRVIDARSDIYALGLILFELLAGQSPFPRALAAGAELVALRRAGAPSLRALNPAVPFAVESLVLTCLAFDPAARYQSATALRDDLERQLVHRPLLVAPEPSRRERFRKWSRRNPRLASGSTVAALAACALLASGGALLAARHDNRALARAAVAKQFLTEGRVAAADLGVGFVEPETAAGHRAAVSEALAIYGAGTDPQWQSRPDFAELPAEKQKQVRRLAGELLTLSARLAPAPEAEVLTRAAAGCGPEDFDPAMRRRLKAFDLAKAGNYDAALPLAIQGADEAPDDLASHLLRASCYLRLERWDDAKGVLDTCVALAPDHYWARVQRARLRAQRDDAAGAGADFAAAIQMRPDAPLAYAMRAFAGQDAGDHAGALADAEAALARGGEPRLHFVRADALAKLGRAAEAEEARRRGLAAEPATATGFAERGVARRKSEPQAALADLRRAIALDPTAPQLWVSLASVYDQDLRDEPASIEALNHALGLRPDHRYALSGRAVMLARKGDRAAAHADAELVLSMGCPALCYYQAAGAFALTSGAHPEDKSKALDLLATAFRANPALVDYVADDPDLKPLAGDGEFRDTIRAAETLRRAKR